MSVSTETDPIEEQEPELGGHMSFLDHLEELRRRILNALIAVGVSFCVCWYFSGSTRRHHFAASSSRSAGPLHYMTLTEPFNLKIEIAFIVSLFAASPFILAQLWLFVSPGLHKHEKKHMLPFAFGASTLFIIGGMFAYFVAFPFAAQFLNSVGTENLKMIPVINAKDYFDLFSTIILLMGVVFEIPAIIFILARLGLVTAGFLLRHMRYAVLLTAIVAAVITPTSDIPNMMIVMVPMMLLYILGIGVAYIFGKKDKKDKKDD